MTPPAAPSLERAAFRGEFRSYQADLLGLVPGHLDDGRIHVVAAPGSGKTVLGLELIRRLGAPALILSPTVVIAHQWGERFRDFFLPPNEALDAYVSERLDRPAVLTSVTYQALHAAMTGRKAQPEPDAADPAWEQEDGQRPAGQAVPDAPEGGRAFDLLATLRAAGVRTICLDEAHHLRREWQKALESLLAQMEGEVQIIALTATPPLDAERAQWDRYASLCGPIDAEIFVHELVREGTLCPHQDYIYLNYPTEPELRAIADHRRRIDGFLQRLVGEGTVGQALLAGGFDAAARHLPDSTFEDADSWLALATVAAHYGQPVNGLLMKELHGRRAAPQLTLEVAAQAAEFLTGRPDLFAGLSDTALGLAHQFQLVHKKRLQIASDERLDSELKRSVGKLDSITRIARLEHEVLGPQLRLVVLSDFIRRDHLGLVGTSQPLLAMGAVPVFEALRRSLPVDVPLGLVSGSLVIMPDAALPSLRDSAAARGVVIEARPLIGSGHSRVDFSGSNRDKVALVTEAFRRGEVRVLVGTAALLGEGWDSPCVNSLVLASFVASFVLSNQMRGRAIRTDPDQPDKTANIWHLAAVEPPPRDRDAVSPADHRRPAGTDFATVARRFDGFMGPVYGQPFITSGVRRIRSIEPPFDRSGVAAVNARTERLAADRGRLAAEWRGTEDQTARAEVSEVVETPRPLPVAFVFADTLTLAAVTFLLIGLPTAVLRVLGSADGGSGARGGRGDASLLEWLDTSGAVALLAVVAVCVGLIAIGSILGKRIVNTLLPIRAATRIGEAVLATLLRSGQLSSPGTQVTVETGRFGGEVSWALMGATLRDKTTFAAAIAEVMSPVDNPRYLVIQRRPLGLGLRPAASFAAPAAVSNAQTAKVFREELRHRLGRYDLVYTRNAAGRRWLLRCRRRSYLNRDARFAQRMQRLLERPATLAG
ncbi:MAG: DEAD/DEAH box helicase family protein [Bifidobacteriaceae bacterium]|jgi:superfamily II DNA or RNA helicase|nr:DEAD/DEAH box helicase family protein [Bifidobacteriaceae bacterium]